MDMSQYRDLFVTEAREHLTAFNGLIVSLEESPGNKAALDEIFRHAHSLKGMAATMMFDPVTALAHAMEDLLSLVRSGQATFVPRLADLMLECSDALAVMVSQIESQAPALTETPELLKKLAAFDFAAGERTKQQAPQEAPVVLPVQQQPSHQFRQNDSLKSIRIKTEVLDHLVNITGELITNRHNLDECARRSGNAELEQPLKQLAALLRELRDTVFKARMVPFAFIAERFPRLVRDLARKQGKEIAFHLDGKNIELDRGVLEEISEPLVHILRNAVDHGMELPDERLAAGKTSEGRITLTVARDKDHVEVSIMDDGHGIDPEKLKLQAIEKGVISAERASLLTLPETFMLICSAGFSTAKTVSDISGRGVGMDAVKSTVHSLGGSLTIHSESGKGTRIVLKLPVTVSIIPALLVKCGTVEVAVPINMVARTLEIWPEEIIKEDGQEMIALDDGLVPLKSLNQLLGQPSATLPDVNPLPALLCEAGGSPTAFTADRLCGQHEIFIRPLGSPLACLRELTGATITGEGRIVFVVDPAALA